MHGLFYYVEWATVPLWLGFNLFWTLRLVFGLWPNDAPEVEQEPRSEWYARQADWRR
jgi:hypothetical protein